MKRLMIATLLSIAMSASHAGDASQASNPSNAIGDMSATVVAGSVLSVAVTGSVVVASVKEIGDDLEILLEGASDASTATVRLSGKAAKGLSVAAGTVVQVTAVSTGHLLVASGKVLAFIPNEAGKALLHHSRVEG
ncbi:hypothetical protein [Massilia endophytica]|uniref:hypothetical protein n=1 Tax=Massilia endophytica TaxID=2899220 RepID=UPI001E318A09|nr:hypothetical protein [Massilia endophytica]UGQ45713.1 hypothetical protein LSQ66_18265 [Massilia endophytica]